MLPGADTAPRYPQRAMERIEWSVPEVGQEELAEILSSFEANWLTMGPKVKAFETAMAEFLQVPHAIAVSNGSVAIDLVLQMLDIGPGDEVIVPSMTYFATAAAVSRVGGVPVFVDIDPISLNLDPERVVEAIGPRTKAMIFIDYGGNPAAIDELLALGREHGIEVVQDAAQSLGGSYKGKPLGGQAKVSTMSFHMAKVMTTVEGGMIFTHDAEIDRLARIYRSQGESAKYIHTHLGTNARMNDLMAGVGLAQVRKLPWMLAERKRVAQSYSRHFAGSAVGTMPCVRPQCEHANFLYPVLVENRDAVVDALKAAHIDTRLVYPMPLYEQEVFATGRATSRAYASPVSEAMCRQALALPMFPRMTEAQIQRVADVCKATARAPSALRAAA
jgi:dTDP-4-amino-4,6-dideoxygalactose transaminase